MKLNDIFDIINGEVDGEEVKEFAKLYRQYPLRLSYSSYGKGMEFLRDEYAAMGLEAELLSFPADGRTVYADRHFPYAWDIYEAWAEVDGERICDYEENTYSVVPFSADSNGVCEKKLLPIDDLADITDLKDYAALITRFPSGADIRSLTSRGCEAFFSTVDLEPVDPSLDDSRRWYNDLFGAGQMDYRDKACTGFSITPRIGRSLMKKLAEKNGPLTVKYLMHTDTHEGEVNAVTSVIKGEDDRCFIVSAHGYEPHATNNVAGIAMSMGAAKALSRLIADGRLPRPKHSIRFFHGLENFSLYAWGMANREKMANALGGTSIDSFGRYGAGGRTEHFVLRRCLNVHPSEQHALAREVLKKVCESRGIGFETREASKNNEDLMQDNQFGPAWNLLYGTLWEEPRETYPRCYFYHTSTDVPEDLSPEMLSAASVYSATLAYYVACCDDEPELTQLAIEDWHRYVDDKCREALRLEDTEPELRKLRAQRLMTWKQFAAASGAKAIRDPEAVKEFTNYINAQTAAAVKVLCGSAAPIAVPDTEAAKTVIRRTIPGPIGLGTIDDKLREKAAKVLGYYCNEYWCLEECGANLYYFDGNRSLGDVARIVWATRMYEKHEDPEGFAKEYRLYEGIQEILLEGGLAEKAERTHISKDDIRKALADLGIKAGDTVMVHSSLKALGKIEDGAKSVIDALKETVTEDGIIAMPAFTDCVEGGTRGAFDPQETAVETWVGIIPEVFRRSEGVIRSTHPTHSISVYGRRAAEFISQEDRQDCFAQDGPWGRLAKSGKILFIGPVYGGNTFMHACEAWYAGYLDETMAYVKTADGQKTVRVTNYPGGCRGGWYKLGKSAAFYRKLSSKGIYKEIPVGESTMAVCSAAEYAAGMKDLFAEDKYILLHKEGCRDCARMKAKKG